MFDGVKQILKLDQNKVLRITEPKKKTANLIIFTIYWYQTPEYNYRNTVVCTCRLLRYHRHHPFSDYTLVRNCPVKKSLILKTTGHILDIL